MGQCQFFVQRKRRFCRLRARDTAQYCGEHLTAAETADGADERIPCPLDPHHSIFARELEKHLTRCNARPGPTPDYYAEDINVLGGASAAARAPEEDVEGTESVLLRGMQPGDFCEAAAKVDALLAVVGATEAAADEDALTVYGAISGTVKEQLQKDAISAFILPALAGPGTAVVEMGCGKGGLSHHLITAHTAACQGTRFYLVDRDNFRGKLDKRAAERGIAVERAQIDIKDLSLDRLLPPDVARVVVISKHLCGPATCLALAAVRNLAAARPGIDVRIYVALCCHQRCTAQMYAYQGLLTHCTARDFSRICGLSSWAVCGWRYGCKDAGDVHHSGFTYDECAALGRRCKQLLNAGRLVFLRQTLGFTARIVPYISRSVTLENALLVASSPQ